MVRYRFDRFTLSPGRRLLLLDGQEVPLIPKYFDLLLLLIERRHEAVHRREIFERIWSDSIVSDSALSQAVRTIRRALGDDSKDPRYIRTVSRHGYRFVCDQVIEEREEAPVVGAPVMAPASPGAPRWDDGALGGGVAGAVAGVAGGLMLALGPGSTGTLALVPVLTMLGGAAGVVGGAGVGLGVTIGRERLPGPRWSRLVIGAALGGGVTGTVVQWLVHWTLTAVFGLTVPIGGGFEGLAIGAAVGVAIAPQGFRAPWQPLVWSAVCCGAVGWLLGWSGRPLVGGTVQVMAQAVDASRVMLAPVGLLFGEPSLGPVSRGVIALCECALFGVGVRWRLCRPSRTGA